ncbi:hypothetical protein [Candidatus Protochlamydia phocaeensis]|uniref:hypothetical protein n=1 Tax=Candidatus Protochlamydia phocaeensis TaxID=1414722 RepID=UPI000837C277|nr:hypothetical protein [Candidatus Protochlamydia phocaeensis]
MSHSIHSFYASSGPQYHYTFTFNGKTYHVDEKTVRTVKILLDPILKTPSAIGTGGHPLFELKAEPLLNEPAFENILHFFHHGKLQEGICIDQMLKLEVPTDYYCLSLLRNCLYETAHKKTAAIDLLKENTHMSPFDRLELAAMQQEINVFCKILLWAVQKKRRHELVSEEDDGFNAGDKNELKKIIIHFNPSMFNKLMSRIMRPKFPTLYPLLVKAYVQFYQYGLADILPFLIDDQLRWDCLAEWPLIEDRMLWFRQMSVKPPAHFIRRAIIRPLLLAGRFSEAKEWMKLCQNKTELSEKANNESRTRSLGAICEQEEKKEKEQESIASLEDMAFDDLKTEAKKNPAVIMQQVIESYCNQFKPISGQLSCDSHSDEGIIEKVERALTREIGISWNKKLFTLFIRQYIRAGIEVLCEKKYEHLKEANHQLTSYDKVLHPAIMEDLAILKSAADDLYVEISKELESYKALNKEIEGDFSIKLVLDEMLSAARYLYQKTFSLKKDFIVQSTSVYLQAYVIGDKAGISKPDLREPFLFRLEKDVQAAKLGDELEAKDLELAIQVYIRKGVEAANYRKYPLGTNKLHPYLENQAEELLRMKDALKEALEYDFPSDYLCKKYGECIQGPQLIRSIFLEALKAYYRTFPPEEVVCEKYKPTLI